MSLKPFRHAHSSDKEHQANNQEQEKEKFRNSRRSRGNTGKSKERSYQRNHQKNNSPTQHNDPPPFLIRPSTRCYAHLVEGRARSEPDWRFRRRRSSALHLGQRELEAGDFVNQFRPAKNEAGINL